MGKINELLSALKKDILKDMKADSSKEEIDRINALTQQIDAIDAEGTKIENDKADITKMYVDAVKNQGSNKPEDDGAGGEPAPVTLEDCIKAELAKDKN